ncbi:amino acid/amide ABC transporter ATP-binding protein 1, HAAT family [Magnetococcus marinus MC-1]|uniref:Amino acid/amide ABC transporter ATP-binding protein 1, HAAT family n=1 Tax=Magnetococcus marinus (strain ATCC BAA-1437 / JCM 17883 / MC-1) TaxID=156889 RepID=A0L4X1_MAGMM|nr:ATP-binding cassette domain-containing protein [Magnetococcus marinus]ABK43014.1 amino acid/amide ABC transporter ATP-binding protein 1, HAAT family [Magnetococcus marinus MC-1]
MSLLTVEDLTMCFGGLTALNQVSFGVERGSITSLIGPNGAGKTTLFNCVTGFYRATAGEIWLHRPGQQGQDLVEMLGQPFRLGDWVDARAFTRRVWFKVFGGSHRVARAGVARTFQNIRLFREMTVLENLLVAQHGRVNRNLVAGIVQTAAFRRSEREALERALYWLAEMGLEQSANQLAGALPYGYQRRLEIARALCTDPVLICLDEPAAGLNPRETAELSGMMEGLRARHGLTIFLIEHDMGLVMEISDHVVVLDHGEVIARGTPQQVQKNPRVLEAYLGVEEAA